MADDEDITPRTGELTTAHYGWVKPTVGDSDDAWGGYLNSDLDGIDSTVFGVSGVANAAYPASNPAGYITAAAIPAPYVLPTASTSVLGGVKVDGSSITIAGGVISAPTTGAYLPLTAGASFPLTGLLYANNGVVINNASTSAKSINSQSAGVTRWSLYLGGGGAESGGNVGNDLVILNYSDAGVPISTSPNPLVITRATGVTTLSNLSAPQAIGDNRIINGDMRIDQRNNGASGTANGYTIDRWRYDGAQVSKGTWIRGPAAANLIALGYGYNLQFGSTSAYAVLAGDYFVFSQSIEADMVADFAWGSANAQPVTLSFWAYSSLSGTFGGSIRNGTATRSFPFSYSLPAANTWTKIVITIPGDVGGTWTLSGNGAGVGVVFNLGCGATFSAPSGAWTAGNYFAPPGVISVVGTNGAFFNLTGVKLEIGSVATPFNRQSLAKSMADCQRYYQSITQGALVGYNPAAANVGGSSMLLPVVMRAAPTVGLGVPLYGNASTLAVSSNYADQVRLQCTVVGTGNYYAIAVPLTLSAEL